MSNWARLRAAAWAAAATHLVAGAAMACILRKGLATNPDVEARLRFITEQPVSWTMAWLCWNAAALTILYFFVCFFRVNQSDNGRLLFPVMLVAAAVAADLTAESIAMGVWPEVAVQVLRARTTAMGQFEMWDRTVTMLTGYLANGLYALATMLAVWPTRSDYPRAVWLVGLAVAGVGVALSIAALYDSVPALVWTNALLVPCIILWQVGVAITAGKRARALG
jgi:hypothetical protein